MADGRTIGNRLGPPRFLAFLALLVGAVPTAWRFFDDAALGLMAGFDASAVFFLLIALPLLRTSDGTTIQKDADANDANRAMLLAITIIVLAVLLVAIAAETVGQRPQPLTKLLIIATLGLAWLFSNLVYAFHYAHLAYRGGTRGSARGIRFPGTREPVYWDFVYFAFTLGMTFQTSDVQIEDQGIRRTVTAHSLAAFVFNIGVLAFTINVLGSR